VFNNAFTVYNRSPYFSHEQYNGLYSLDTVVVPGVLLLLSLPLFSSIVLFNKRWRKNYLFVIYYFCTIPIAIVNMSSHLINFLENGSSFCVNNAVAYSSSEPMLMICWIQSTIQNYFQWATTLAFTVISVDLAVLVIRGKTLSRSWKAIVALIFLVPVVPTAYMLAQGDQGYQPPFDSCANRNASVNFIPHVIMVGIFLVALFASYFKIALLLYESESYEHRINILYNKVLFSVPMLFCTLTALTYISMVAVRGSMLRTVATAKSSGELQAQIECIFKYFDGSDDNSWITQCGDGLKSLSQITATKKIAAYLHNSQHFFIIIALFPMIYRSTLKPVLGVAVQGENGLDSLSMNVNGRTEIKPTVIFDGAISSKMLSMLKVIRKDKILPEEDPNEDVNDAADSEFATSQGLSGSVQLPTESSNL
jgi:hypothetical protein